MSSPQNDPRAVVKRLAVAILLSIPPLTASVVVLNLFHPDLRIVPPSRPTGVADTVPARVHAQPAPVADIHPLTVRSELLLDKQDSPTLSDRKTQLALMFISKHPLPHARW